MQAVVRWAQRRGVAVIPRSGGHSYAGYSTGTGVVVDLSALRGIRIEGGTAVIGAGSRLIDVYAALAARGGTIPAGSCATVGLGGLALGGGVGLASRKLGLTCDNVESLRIVTADGRVLDCDERRQRRSLLGLPRRRRPELRDRHEPPFTRVACVDRLVLLRLVAVVGSDGRRAGLAALGAARDRCADDDLPAVHGWIGAHAPGVRAAPRARVTATRPARSAVSRGSAVEPHHRDVRVPRPDASLGRLPRPVAGGLSPRLGARLALAGDVRGQIRLRREALRPCGRAGAPAPPRGAAGIASRLGRSDHGLLRRRDRGCPARCDGLRPSLAALLAPVPRLLGRSRSTRRPRSAGSVASTTRCAPM